MVIVDIFVVNISESIIVQILKIWLKFHWHSSKKKPKFIQHVPVLKSMILRRENFVVTYFLSEKGQTERYKWPGLKESKMIVSERRNDDLQSDNQQNDCLSKDTQKNDNKINCTQIDA